MPETAQAPPPGQGRPRLGLVWQLLVLVLALLLAVTVTIALIQRQMLAAETTRIERERLGALPGVLDGLLDQDRDRLVLLGGQTLAGTDAGDRADLQRKLEAAVFAAGLDSMAVFDAGLRPLAKVAPGGAADRPWLAAMIGATLREGRPQSRLVCDERCLFHVSAPALDRRGREVAIILCDDLAHVLPQFRDLTGADLALLVQRQPGDTGAAVLGASLAAVSNAPTLRPQLEQLPAPARPPELAEPLRISAGGRHQVLAAQPLDTAEGSRRAEALFILDLPEAGAMARVFWRSTLVAVVVMLAGAGVLLLFTLPAIRRLEHLIRVLPQLADRAFDRARQAVEAEQRGRRITDEIDELGDTVLWLVERLEQLDRAEAESEAKSRFLAAMSHEIRTPMNGVIATLELLELQGLQPEQRESVSVIRESARALLRVIDDILDFSKVEAGQVDVERVPLSLERIVEDTTQTLAPALRGKPVHLFAFVDPRLAETVLGDPVRLRQVLFNLCGNAIKFTPSGRVLVRADAVGGAPGRVRFSVQDTGIGIPAAAQARLFQPFRQADASTRRRFGGTGLGLSISRGLVERMGGALRFRSEPGQGSEFWFELEFPVEEPARDQQPLAGVRVHLQVADPDEQQALAVYAGADGAVVVDAAAEATLQVEEDERSGGLRVLARSGQRRWLRRPVHRRVFGETLALAAGLAKAPDEVRPEPPRAPAAGRDCRILVAEDHAVNRRVLQQQLEQLGYPADLVEDGPGALEALHRAHYDLLITDLEMPGLDGFELAREVRRREAASGSGRMPIVALSASVMQGEAERCRAAGADDYLAKPVALQALGESLDRWLRPGRPPPIDRSVLRTWVGDDPGFAAEVLRDFVRINRPMFDELRAAGAGGALRQVRDLAHKLRGSALTAGAVELGAALRSLEDVARAGPAAEVAPAIERALADFDEACRWIERESA